MPRESKMKLPPHNIAVKNAMLTVETRYEYDPKQGERVPIPRREKAVDALARWGAKINSITWGVLECRDITLSEIRDLEKMAAEMETAVESMSGKGSC
tara:strand:- start:2154 stop:2447 length:294 start_codon:yes stop_codon:yes gene_type:complete